MKLTTLWVYLVHTGGRSSLRREANVYNEILGTNISESVGTYLGCSTSSPKRVKLRLVSYTGSSNKFRLCPKKPVYQVVSSGAVCTRMELMGYESCLESLTIRHSSDVY